MMALHASGRRAGPNAGIAIGPILFIIAILAILAAAIAAGSGSFTAGTGAESNKTKSSALVQIGENLRLGMDQITMEVGVPVGSVDIDISHTTTNQMLFSPTGGGIAPPSVGMSNDPIHDAWSFPQGRPTGLGTGNANDVIAVLPVSAGVCAEVNNRALGISAIPPAMDLGTFLSTGSGQLASTYFPGPTEAASWTVQGPNSATRTGPSLIGAAVGCVYNSNSAALTSTCTQNTTTGVTACTSSTTVGPTSPYFFFQVLGIQ